MSVGCDARVFLIMIPAPVTFCWASRSVWLVRAGTSCQVNEAEERVVWPQ